MERRASPHIAVDQRETSRATQLTASYVVALLAAATVLSYLTRAQVGPQIKPFIEISATITGSAELFTALLLLTQFYMARRLALGIVAAGYTMCGLLTIPFLLFFPDIFNTSVQSPDYRQISVWLWAASHLAFPVAIAAAHLVDPSLDRVTVPRERIPLTFSIVLGSTIGLTLAMVAGILVARTALPVFITTNGSFTPAYRGTLIPLIVAANAAAVAIVVVRGRRLSPLQTWLGVALVTLLLGGLLNFWSPGRYSFPWYIGKFEGLIMACVVLAMLLNGVSKLYRHLYHVATIDVLTGLPNRRNFIELATTVLAEPARLGKGVAILVIDVDHFKPYNDRYGHLAGDEALAAVASTFEESLPGAYDSVARYGGEEFVILLPDVTPGEAETVAEHVRQHVAKLGIVHDREPKGHLTVSVGIGYCSRDQNVSEPVLFETADLALYDAKAKGRDCVALRHVAENAPAIAS